MADITPDEFRGLAKVAGLRLLDEDVEPLTVQFNALREGLEVLDEHDVYGVAPLPALQYPAEAPGSVRQARQGERAGRASGSLTYGKLRPPDGVQDRSRSWRTCCGRSRCRRWS